MNIEEIKALFPLKGRITEEILDNSYVLNPEKCIGANTLKKALGTNRIPGYMLVRWGVKNGGLYDRLSSGLDGYKLLSITTEQQIDMPWTTDAQDVTFIIKTDTL